MITTIHTMLHMQSIANFAYIIANKDVAVVTTENEMRKGSV